VEQGIVKERKIPMKKIFKIIVLSVLLMIFQLKIQAHTLNHLKNDILISKNKTVSLKEKAEIVLDNDVENYRWEILADTTNFNPYKIKSKIDGKDVKVRVEKGFSSSVILNLGKVSKGKHVVELYYKYKISGSENLDGNYEIFIPVYSRYRKPDDISNIIEPQKFDYSLTMENSTVIPKITLLNYFNNEIEKIDLKSPVLGYVEIYKDYFKKKDGNIIKNDDLKQRGNDLVHKQNKNFFSIVLSFVLIPFTIFLFVLWIIYKIQKNKRKKFKKQMKGEK
jgi:hypothetical protein